MKIEPKFLNKLKKDLRGLQATVAREMTETTGKKHNRSTVSRVLDGQINNEEIIKKCLEIRDREKKRMDELQKQILAS